MPRLGGELKLGSGLLQSVEIVRKLACQSASSAAYGLRRACLHFSFGLFCIVISPSVSAVGTVAGTTISNTATLSYILAGVGQPDLSASVSFIVDEVIQPTLTWQDGASVPVNSPDTNRALTFALTNAGNGSETFGLVRTNGPAPIPAGNFTPSLPADVAIGAIYLESGSLAGFQATGPNQDTLYVSGTNDPNLLPGTSQTIYVISDTPSVSLNSRGEVLLQASSLTAGVAGAALGTGFPGLGQGGNIAVAGIGSGRSAATGSYISSGLVVSVNKIVAAVVDPDGGSTKMTGAVMTYQITAALGGSGTAKGLIISDILPAEVTYELNSIKVDGVAKTDAVDADNAKKIISGTNTEIQVVLGDVAAPANVVVTFRATIK